MNTEISNINTIGIDVPILLLGKHFTGDYSNSQNYVTEVQDLLKTEGIEHVPFKVMGVFYDNPQEKKVDELRSFHAVYPIDPVASEKSSLEKFLLHGNFLQVKIKGDPSKTIFEGYGALFSHIKEHNVQLKSNACYQIMSLENGQITTEILMKLADN